MPIRSRTSPSRLVPRTSAGNPYQVPQADTATKVLGAGRTLPGSPRQAPDHRLSGSEAVFLHIPPEQLEHVFDALPKDLRSLVTPEA
ncbi:hypothetical protein ACIRYZ_37085 [Kitasatospora sp. NPDC101155]|uniref:hypothetical protein n=1 Tax=Kitasatospora sp. NPDC101155 TaxID=3364097 RepID=UPI00380A2D5D